MVNNMAGKRSLIYGVAINDADYLTQRKIKGKNVQCIFYATWKSMLSRCYCKKYQSKQPTYVKCTVCYEWLKFSNFKSWMESQDWQGKYLDKDIIKDGNTVYSPDNCLFVDRVLNNFTTDRRNHRGAYPIGVCIDMKTGKFIAQCSDPFTKSRGYLGLFDCPYKAHTAWRKRKHELACRLADMQPDKRIAGALRARYAP